MKRELDAKFNLGFVVRVNPEGYRKIKDFIEESTDVDVVFSHISGNKLYIKEEGQHER